MTSLAERVADLPPMDVAGRGDRLRELFAAERIDGLLVTSLTNIRYLTGFTGSAGVVVVSGDELVLVTDGRYTEQAADQLARAGVRARLEITSTEQRQVVAAALGPAARIGLEADHVTWAAQRRYDNEWFTDQVVVATSGLVERLRRFKDDGELARMEVAAAVADAALAQLRPWLLDGPTESEFAVELDATMRRLGATKPSFETIVASGPNGARPHARPSGRRVEPGDLVVIDFGAVIDGYCSDMTRTVAVGDVDDTSVRMLEVVTAAQAAGVAAVGPGVAAVDVDAACRAVIGEAGWAAAFSHGTGHGVGLDIHEDPRVGTTSTATLAVGDVVTVEPGVYLPAHGGVRVEDTVVVTPEGCRPLTHTTKDPAP
ncbi:MAG TPA: aminopeptidase P family protein [Acidimicrobiales bacterium]